MWKGFNDLFPLSTHNTVQALYTAPQYNMDLDMSQSYGGSQIFLAWNFTMEL